MPSAARRPAVSAETLFKAFAEPIRLRLLALIEGGETCVCHLVETLGLPQPTVSRHLAVLRRAGLVDVRKEGLWCHYSLRAPGSDLHARLLDCLASCREELSGLKAEVKCCTRLRAGPRGR